MENVDAFKDILGNFDVNTGINSSVIICTVIGILTVIASFVVFLVFIRKRHKGTFFTYIGGVSTALLFYVTGGSISNVILNLFPKSASSSTAVCIITAVIVSSLMAWGGRLIAIKLFERRMDKISSSFSMGLGIMTVEAISKIITLFANLIIFYTINDLGCKELLNRANGQDDFVTTLDLLKETQAITGTQMIVAAVVTIIFMLFHIAMSVPMFAAFKKQISKVHLAICYGVFVLIETLIYMNNYKIINQAVYVALLILLAVGFILYVMRIYNEYYKAEAFEKQQKDEEHKKMPRFGNLSNL